MIQSVQPVQAIPQLKNSTPAANTHLPLNPSSKALAVMPPNQEHVSIHKNRCMVRECHGLPWGFPK
jgi:hypothetical protein